jgi:hypothetical protein
MSDISAIDQSGYSHGIDPITWAEHIVGALIEIHLLVDCDRADDPATWPCYNIDLTIEALASRILGDLLDAG